MIIFRNKEELELMQKYRMETLLYQLTVKKWGQDTNYSMLLNQKENLGYFLWKSIVQF